MSNICIVTAVDDDDILRWGFEPGKVVMPMVIFARPAIIDILRDTQPSPAIIFEPLLPPSPLSVMDKVSALNMAYSMNYHSSDYYYWIDAEILYKHLVFEYLYSNILGDALTPVRDKTTYLHTAGYPKNSFFGGPKHELKSLYFQMTACLNSFFDPDLAPAIDFPLQDGYEAAMPKDHPQDLNLMVASHIRDRIVHIIGDSHTLFCFTVNKSIGCRSNILDKTSVLSEITTPYTYQFTHHIGGRTMYHIGQPGNLETYARESLVKDHDALVCVFGEIDVRSHIFKQHYEHQRSVDEIIRTLVTNYVKNIVALKNSYNNLQVIVFGPIPPLDNPDYSSVELPVSGSIEERIAATQQLNTLLEQLCAKQQIAFINVADLFATEKGDLQWDMSDHFCHISHYHHQPIIDRLYNLLTA